MKVLVPALLTSLLVLSGCAPAAQSSVNAAPSPAVTGSNPVVAAGQRWTVNWGDGPAQTYTVGPLVDNSFGFLVYDQKNALPSVVFMYSEASTLSPAYLDVSYYSGNTEKHCIVRQPAASAVNSTLTGVWYTTTTFAAQDEYLSGQPVNAPTCTLVRVQ